MKTREQENETGPVDYEMGVKLVAAQIIAAAADLAVKSDKKLNVVLDDFAEGVNDLTSDGVK